MKIVIATFILVLISGLSFGQSKEAIKKRNKVEKGTKPFDPSFNMKGSHISVTFRLENGQFVPVSAKKQKGKVYYRSSEKGEFKIEYADASGKIIGTLYQSDPTIRRSCDEGENSIEEVSSGTEIEILLPYNKEIGSISFATNNRDKQFGTVDIKELMKGVQ